MKGVEQPARGAKRQKRRSIGISKKLYRSTALVFLSSILLIVLMIFFFVRVYLNRQDQVKADKLGGQISAQIHDVLDDAQRLCDIVGKNYDIQQAIRMPASGDLALEAKERTDINGKIAQITQSFTGNIDNIGLFLQDGRRFKYGAFSYERGDVRTEEWYEALLERDEFRWIGVYDTSQALHSLEWGCFVGGMNLVNMRNNQVCGVVLTEISFSSIAKLLDEWASQDVYIELIAADGAVLHRTGDDARRMTGVASEVALTDYFFARIHVDQYTVLDDFSKLLLVLAVLGVAVALGMMKFCANGLKRSIARPIEQLLGCVNAFEDAHSDAHIDIDTDIAEFTRLIDGVEDLFGRIRVLLRTREEGQKVIRRAQVAALQEQINPHFLYNTMDSISWLIRTDEKEKALGALSSFATLFRLSLNNGRNYVTIEEESTYIRHYVDILNVRYSGQLNCTWETPDADLMQSYLPKLVLQPLVENSIEHGIGMRDSQRGEIRIRVVREEAGARIEVWDDGMGIEPDALTQINQHLENAENPEGKARPSYGIYNVNNRLRVAYGKEYGIKYESEYGVYTRVTMRFPLCNAKGESVYD